MATIKKFEDLKVWQKARILCQYVFEIIEYPNFSKDYKLKDQINGSSGSVMDNIADPNISFDEKGICNYYYEYIKAENEQVKNGAEGEKEFVPAWEVGIVPPPVATEVCKMP